MDVKIREEGPDLSKWPSATTIRFVAREATEYMDENGIKYVSVEEALRMSELNCMVCEKNGKQEGS
jgi:hypothetical protein